MRREKLAWEEVYMLDNFLLVSFPIIFLYQDFRTDQVIHDPVLNRKVTPHVMLTRARMVICF